jgi:hypothetical protein
LRKTQIVVNDVRTDATDWPPDRYQDFASWRDPCPVALTREFQHRQFNFWCFLVRLYSAGIGIHAIARG